MKRSPLHDVHAAAGATFVDFAGFEMPVHYGSIKQEHMAVRGGVGLFDVSHMSNLRVLDGAEQAFKRATPKDPGTISIGKGAYTVMLHPDGTILDDTFLFHLEDHWLVIPNAGANATVAAHLEARGAHVEDETSNQAILALQGPEARQVLADAAAGDAPRFHEIRPMQIGTARCLVSGTGYTGEKGVELYVHQDDAHEVWQTLMTAGRQRDIRPIGLGARDTLRLEKGYCLAGNEFADGRTPLEAGLDWLIDWNMDFEARSALQHQRQAGHVRLWGLTLPKGIPRRGFAVKRSGQPIGAVTSGTMSPSLGHGIALAYLDGCQPEDKVEVDVRGAEMPATVVAPPFL